MKGIAYMMDNKVLNTTTELRPASKPFSLRTSIQQAMQQYFAKLDGADPANLYEMFLEEVEKPLLEMVLQFTRGNQSRAAIVLGISRGTLRKKMKMYGLD